MSTVETGITKKKICRKFSQKKLYNWLQLGERADNESVNLYQFDCLEMHRQNTVFQLN